MEIAARSVALVAPIGIAVVALKFNPPDLFMLINALVLAVSLGFLTRRLTRNMLMFADHYVRLSIFVSVISFLSSIVWFFVKLGYMAPLLAGASLATLTAILLATDRYYHDLTR